MYWFLETFLNYKNIQIKKNYSDIRTRDDGKLKLLSSLRGRAPVHAGSSRGIWGVYGSSLGAAGLVAGFVRDALRHLLMGLVHS